MGKINCFFGKHKWSKYVYTTKTNPPIYQRYCENCDKIESLSVKDYLDMKEESFKEFLSCYEVLFRLIDIKLGKGAFIECYDIVHDMYNEDVSEFDQPHKDRFYETIVSGIEYLHRPNPDNPDEYSTQFCGGTCYSTVKDGPSHLPPHHIPDRLEEELEKLKNFYK
jgi:hypothetical protein